MVDTIDVQHVGFKQLGFFVIAHNHRAIAFYENLDFKKIGCHQKILNWYRQYLDASEMEMWLC